MTSIFRFPTLLLLLAFLTNSVHTATSPFAFRTGEIVYHYSVSIPVGNYAIRNAATKQYLVFHPNNVTNIVVPGKGGQNMVAPATTWKVVLHGAKNYSIHHLARNGQDKCMSTRFTDGIDDAAVMW
ncbi:hypothetical protein BC937DRAFT_91391 [Endogone sp. FLAS-F59071]|nr:hypothetical protein BC937DRAFT_91391 [Endogone sp. FLAS-F59071]|eukprot:RUS16297.1 hypothetical protein BC937DRAFT_91391 [Endogone sp. FLAS-F59071]